MKIYFVGSIRASHEDKGWYLYIAKTLDNYGEVLTENFRHPISAPLGQKPKNREVYEREVRWLRQADRVVAEVTTPSLEVGYLIGLAELWRKPVLCLYRKGGSQVLSPLIAGSEYLTIRLYEGKIDMERSIKYFLKH